MNKNQINPSILQEFLDSATNAADKGQAQYLTPPELAALIAGPLPDARPTIIDFNSGHGTLLRAAANKTTDHLLACDIDPSCLAKIRHGHSITIPATRFEEAYTHHASGDFINADVTLLAELLHDVQFKADLFTLNPPWDLHWHRDRLKHLADSDLPAVADAFAGTDPRTGRDAIDSSVATLMLALHHSTIRGEGFLITNASTADRLLFANNAPHKPLTKHIWATVRFPMSLFSVSSVPSSAPSVLTPSSASDQPMAIALYFARDHTKGPQQTLTLNSVLSPQSSALAIDRSFRSGLQITWSDYANDKTHHLWEGCRIEFQNRANKDRHDFNLWIDRSGTIRTHLSIFDQAIIPSRALQKEADALNQLDAKTPLFLVTQRAQRDLLLQSAGLSSLSAQHSKSSSLSPQSSSLSTSSSTPWRVDPKLITAIEQALRDYNSVRAPLYPLPKIQRLGYLEEQDSIVCTKDLLHSETGRRLYTAGKSYEFFTRTVTVERDGKRPNVEGEMEDILYTGAELATWIEADNGDQFTFLEARLRAPNVRVTDVRPDNEKPAHARRRKATKRANIDSIPKLNIDFTLHDLADHFHIPEVQDISAARPEQFQLNLRKIFEIESIISANPRFTPALVYKNFQREDYARLACTDGSICAHEPGLGKTWACLSIPLLKCGFTLNGPLKLQPNEPVLIVAPGDLHDQTIEEAKSIFGIHITRLDSQSTFLKLSTLQPDGRRSIPHGFYITSFHQLSVNGVETAPLIAKEVRNADGDREIKMVPEPTCGLFKYELIPKLSLDESASRIKCVHSPSLSDLCCQSFACVMVDEATRMKSDDALIARGVRMLVAPYRFALTATPIKNRVPDIFWLAWWTSGATLAANSRFPYSVLEKEQYAATFCVSETNLTAEQRAAEERKPRRFKKLTPQACNIHRLWKLMAPIVLRRRKKDIGEQIAPKKNHILRVPMATQQSIIYRELIEWEPPDRNGRIATGKVLTALRQAAAAPWLPEIQNAWHDAIAQQITIGKRDYAPPFPAASIHTPKNHAVLNLIQRNIQARQQTILFSPFNEPLDTFKFLLETCGIPSIIMDGRTAPKKRGPLAAEFKKGPPVLPVRKSSAPPDSWEPEHFDWIPNPTPSEYPVLLAGECMTEGHNFFRCANAIVYAYPWAMDKLLQFIDRIHRIVSPYTVNIYRLVADGSIDRKMESQLDEKEDAAELILDGHLIGDQPAETNLMELLRTAQRDFDPASKTIPESTLKSQWPQLRQKLQQAYRVYLHAPQLIQLSTAPQPPTHRTGSWLFRLPDGQPLAA